MPNGNNRNMDRPNDNTHNRNRPNENRFKMNTADENRRNKNTTNGYYQVVYLSPYAFACVRVVGNCGGEGGISGPPFTLLQIVGPKWWVKTLIVSVSADGSRMIIRNRHGCVDVKNRSSVRNLQRKNGKVAKDWLISSKTWTIPNRTGSLKAKQVSCNPKRQKSYYCYLNAESNWNHRAFHQSTQRSMVLGWKLLRKEAGLRV